MNRLRTTVALVLLAGALALAPPARAQEPRLPQRDLIVRVEYIARFLATQGWTWEQLERGALRDAVGDVVSLERIQEAVLLTDPVAWCEAHLVNKPEDGGGLWQLFDYQKPSMRFRGDVVHEDGAEVGKTREIVGLYLFDAINGVGGQLVGAMGDGALADIWSEIEFQLDKNPGLRAYLRKESQKPYRKHTWLNDNVGDFRPGGFDGRAFRGVHAGLAIRLDEAAKAESPDVFSEFFRAAKPNASARLYSVPDGRRGSPFYGLCERAVPYDSIARSAGRDVTSLAGAAGENADWRRRRFTKFHWPKTLMPAPYWSEQREAEAIERYGGRDSAGYVRNVLGGWGDPEYSVFPWATFAPCVRLVDEYVVAKLLWDKTARTVYVDVHRLSHGYQVRSGSDLEDDGASGPAPLHELYRGSFEAGNLVLEDVLRPWLEIAAPGAHLVAGGDVGQNEETELGMSELRGVHYRWRLRIQLRHFSYDDQAKLVRQLDEVYRPDHGWGLDAGGVGKALEDSIRGGDGGWNFDGRLSGFIFNTRVPAVDESGEQLVDPASGRPRTIQVKELATQLLEKAMQRGELVVPWDPDYIRDYPAHTCKRLPSQERTFRGTGDHVIDEKRVEMLRLHELQFGPTVAPELAFATPPGSRRDSASLGDF